MWILKVIGLLLEYFDELLWENCDDVLVLIRVDVFFLMLFVGELLMVLLLDCQVEWCEVFECGCVILLLLFEYVYVEFCDCG